MVRNRRYLHGEDPPEVKITPLDYWRRLNEKSTSARYDKGRNFDVETVRQRIRVNALCNFYYFCRVILERDRFNLTLHEPLCRYFQRVHFKDVLEIPRAHNKTSLASECWPIWRSMRVTDKDIEYIQNLRKEKETYDYDDNFLRYLRRVHNPNHCFLVASSNLVNAKRILRRIRQHWENRQMLRGCFPEMLPKGIAGKDGAGRYDGKWGEEALSINRSDRGRGESTYECIGVDGALQSRHYEHLILDDLIGKEAIESALVMERAIEWFKLLPGVYESYEPGFPGDEIVIGNRWAFSDLNSWIREEQKDYVFHRRCALECPRCGSDTRLADFTENRAICGCGELCAVIYPEQFTLKGLYEIYQREGGYNFSSQFQNCPSSPETQVFQEKWLGWYELYDKNNPELPPSHVADNVSSSTTIRHLRDHGAGEFLETPDRSVWQLSRYMTIDPSGGSMSPVASRHAIVVTGVAEDNKKYLLDVWALQSPPEIMIQMIYILAKKWKLHVVHCEAVSGFKYLPLHLNTLNETMNLTLRVEELDGFVDTGVAGLTNRKDKRITNLSPYFQRREMFVRGDQQKFLEEYATYPRCRYPSADILDALAYGPTPKVWQRPLNPREMHAIETRYMQRLMSSRGPTGY